MTRRYASLGRCRLYDSRRMGLFSPALLIFPVAFRAGSFVLSQEKELCYLSENRLSVTT